MNPLLRLKEPNLLFNYDQSLEDPRDGLSLFGPYDQGRFGINAAVLGTRDGIRKYKAWVQKIQGHVSNNDGDPGRPPYPGFESAFGIPWNPKPIVEIIIDENELTANARSPFRYINAGRRKR